MKALTFRALFFGLFVVGGLAFFASQTHRAAAAASVSLTSGSYETRTTIPVTIDGQRATCILDTGTSAIVVSQSLAQAAHLPSQAGTFELAPDGRTSMDRQTEIAHFAVAGHALENVPALISSNLTEPDALCGYDFFAHFPTLIDRDRRLVTLFPAASQLAHMHCTQVELSSHVPLANIEINGTWFSHIVLDSGMGGGGMLWEGVRSQLQRPLVANANFQTMPGAIAKGFACGAIASVRYAPDAPQSSMPVCTEPQRPDGDNGIIETNLDSVHAMAVDYPQRRICFDVSGYSEVASPAYPSHPAASEGDAWARFNSLRPPKI